TSIFFVVEDGPLNRRRASIFRQERSMDIEASKDGQVQNLPRQDLAVSNHDNEVGLKLRQLIDEGRVEGAVWLENREIRLFWQHFHQRRLPCQMASFGPVGLRDDRRDVDGG